MIKVAVHKEWEYVIHKECLDKGDFTPAEFKVCKEDVKSIYVDGRVCVHCKNLISQTARVLSKPIASKVNKPVASHINGE